MNYAKFYTLLAKIPKYGDNEDQKAQLVSSISHGRTTSLRELTSSEYNALCRLLDERVAGRDQLRKRRSEALRLMTALGIDTSNWGAVDHFCAQPRIAGKVFRQLRCDELIALSRKLRAIAGKRPSHRPKQPTATQPKILYYKPTYNPEGLPS